MFPDTEGQYACKRVFDILRIQSPNVEYAVPTSWMFWFHHFVKDYLALVIHVIIVIFTSFKNPLLFDVSNALKPAFLLLKCCYFSKILLGFLKSDFKKIRTIHFFNDKIVFFHQPG